MSTQTITFPASASWPDIEVYLYTPDTDTVIAGPETATQGINNTSLWSVDFTDVPSGRYQVLWTTDTGSPIGSDYVSNIIADVTASYVLDSNLPLVTDNSPYVYSGV